jgi:hypothetical protein
MEQTECSETSAYKIQTPGNYPEETYNKKITVFPNTDKSYQQNDFFLASRTILIHSVTFRFNVC